MDDGKIYNIASELHEKLVEAGLVDLIGVGTDADAREAARALLDLLVEDLAGHLLNDAVALDALSHGNED